MTNLDKMSQVKSGFRRAAMMLLFIAIAILFVGGMDYLFFPGVHSRAVGVLFLAVSTPIMVITMSRWMKVLSGLLALAVINGLFTIASGHALSNPLPIPRLDGLYLTLFFAACAALASTISRRALSVADRVLVLAFLVGIVFLLESSGAQNLRGMTSLTATNIAFMVFCLCCLLAAWAIDHWRKDRSRHGDHPHSELAA